MKQQQQQDLDKLKKASVENVRLKKSVDAQTHEISKLEKEVEKYRDNTLNEKTREQQKEIQNLKEQKRNLERNLDQQKQAQHNLQKQLDNARQHKGQLQREVYNLQEQLRISDSQKKQQLRDQLRDEQTKLYNAKVEFQKLIRQKDRVGSLLEDAENEFLKKEQEIEDLQGQLVEMEKEYKDRENADIQILQDQNHQLAQKMQELQTSLDKTIQDLQNEMEGKRLVEQDRTFADQQKIEWIIENKLEEAIQDLENYQSRRIEAEKFLRQELEIADERYRNLETRIKTQEELIDFTDEEKRELRAIHSMKLFEVKTEDEDVDKTEFIKTTIAGGEIEAEEWRKRAKKYGIATAKGRACLDAAYRLEFQLDYFRNLVGEIPVTMEARRLLQETIDESDLARYTRFKRWARENLVGLSAIAITVGGIITSVVIGLKKGVTTVATAAWSLGRAFAHIATKVGPIIGSLF